jgi:site-specific DNA recombinase
VFVLALDLLSEPQELYGRAGPAVRKIMNQTISDKLKLDGTTVTADELAEPFDLIVPAGRAYDEPTYYRKRPPALTGVVFHEGVSADGLTSIDLLQLAQGGNGCSKPVMVELRGFEPLTPSMRTRCATGLRYSPENLS